MGSRFDRNKLLIGTYILDVYARSEKHIKELKECNVDFIVALRNDITKETLDLLQKYGVGCDLTGTVPGWWGGDGSNAGKFESRVPLEMYEKAAENFTDHPAVWMIDIGDEPSALDFEYYGKVVAKVKELFPNQVPYLNLYPNYASVAQNTSEQTVNQLGTATYEEHIRRYVEEIDLPYISYDFYVYSLGRDGQGKMYDNFRIVADACRRTGKDFWYVPQCNGMRPTDFTSEEQMRFQALCALCYGATAINWACWTAGWWNNQILDKNGEKTEQYGKLAAVNAELASFGPHYMKYRNVATHMIGFGNMESVTAVRSLKENLKDSLDCGFALGLKPESDSVSLLAGEMIGKDDPQSHALLLMNASDHLCENDSKAKISFTSYSDSVKITSCDSGFPPKDLETEYCGNKKTFTFSIKNAHAVFIEAKD